MRRPALAALALGASLTALGAPARAQTIPGPTGSLQNFRPAPAGDNFFGVAAPDTPGHLVPRANVFFDLAYRPLAIEAPGSQVLSVVGVQGFLHANASLALWNRLLLAVDMPFAIMQSGDSPTVNGVRFQSPSSAELGDLRVGARARIYGESGSAFQLAAGGFVDVPTARADTYAGEGAVSGSPQVHLGGHLPYFVWSLSMGPRLRAGNRPHSFDAGVGLAALLLDDRLQLGAELAFTQPFDDVVRSSLTGLTVATSTSAEILAGAKFRPIPALIFGAAFGPGLTHGWGTPVFRGLAMVGYEPGPAKANLDADGDGVPDEADACKITPGVRSADSRKNGCPLDSDGDGIADAKDACPNVPGPERADPRQNGCLVVEGDTSDAFTRGRCVDAGCESGVGRRELAFSYILRFPRLLTEMASLNDAVTEPFAREVKTLLSTHPEIARLEIEGHGDGGPEERRNQMLAEARARAVRDWLIARGIPADKLVARTGPALPLPSGSSVEDLTAGTRIRFFAVEAPRAGK